MGQPQFYEGMSQPAINDIARNLVDEIRPCKWVATGAMLVHRDVYTAIKTNETFADLRMNAKDMSFDYFRPENNSGEDVIFCERAAASGHQPHVDLGIPMLHVGYACYGAHNTKNPPNLG
jgi:hypothetical protein